MFSQLGPLFKTVFRKAEHSDGRLEIRREEKEHTKKEEKEREETPDDFDLWQDRTEVSIPALKSFLIDFLKNKGDVSDVTGVTSLPSSPLLPDSASAPPPPENALNAKAQRAYGRSASYIHHTEIDQHPETTSAKGAENLSELLNVDEIRTMHLVISALDRLSQQGQQTLVIEKADTFLQALVIAVQKSEPL